MRANKKSKEKLCFSQSKTFRLCVLVMSILLSVIVTLTFISVVKVHTPEQQVALNFNAINVGLALLLGFSTFMVIELIVLVINAVDFSAQRRDYDLFMENINEYSTMLHEINNYYYEISRDSHGSNDLFVTYAKKEIEKLNNTLRVAANQKEFSISSDYILNAAGIFDAFLVSTEKTLRMTFPILGTNEAVFLSSADSHFFEVLQKEVIDGALNLVQVIVIVKNENTFQKEEVKKLLDFFAAESKYECKLCKLDTFKSVCDTNGVQSQFVDFGIYGNKMLFVTEQYTPIHKGTYYKDSNRLRLYIKLFDEIWNSDVLVRQNTSINNTPIKIAELMTYGGPTNSTFSE